MEETFNKFGTAMMPENSQIREYSLNQLRGNWTQPVLCSLVLIVVTGVVEAFLKFLPGIGGLAAMLIVCPLGFGYSITFLRYMRNEEREDMVGQPFRCFQEYGRYLGTSLLLAVYVFLWSLLLVVPGIIKAFSYAMTPYIMYDNPQLSADECIERSMAMMQGHKGQLFMLYLSFIGWAILCVLTLGIGFFWLSPYISCSEAQFYEELKKAEL